MRNSSSVYSNLPTIAVDRLVTPVIPEIGTGKTVRVSFGAITAPLSLASTRAISDTEVTDNPAPTTIGNTLSTSVTSIRSEVGVVRVTVTPATLEVI